MAEFHTICKTADIPEGSARIFVVGELQIGIFHVNGEFFALDNRCPHAAASLARGIIEDETVTCRIHHWQFRLCDGVRSDEACPQSNARCYPLRLERQDVQVKLESYFLRKK